VAGRRPAERTSGETLVKRRHIYSILQASAALVTGGALFQTTGCSPELTDLFATSVSGLATSIVNTFLTLYISQVFGTGGFSF
jgi:hypothetical protein